MGNMVYMVGWISEISSRQPLDRAKILWKTNQDAPKNTTFFVISINKIEDIKKN